MTYWTYRNGTVFLFWKIDLQYTVKIIVKVVLPFEALVQLLDLDLREPYLVASLCCVIHL